ncbi:hypothetical protein N181_30500 [Sinorhizobium fredii USDA 205]|uniref:hypothetical protein n=1 Tax=Rhizobium fredii TaxID=380 RepID=UPI0004AD9552|nr:Adenylate cyclase [Sinorhizobium fredii CCBAU 83666]KSV91954.1 hypothetical protein N181_30500 [Sinorhizobium fredii USDA 205]GEC35560.1 hypothetical protein EFR01_57310 [Sinorhizobium fredii]GLS07205.1 hypothetical protein GCM10007864_08310 [Sinorhizobium fredii]
MPSPGDPFGFVAFLASDRIDRVWEFLAKVLLDDSNTKSNAAASPAQVWISYEALEKTTSGKFSGRKHTAGFRGRPVGDLLLRGRTEPIRAFEPLEAERYASAETQAYLIAFEELAAGDRHAVTAFAALVSRDAEDGLASFHLKRLLNGETSTTITL